MSSALQVDNGFDVGLQYATRESLAAEPLHLRLIPHVRSANPRLSLLLSLSMSCHIYILEGAVLFLQHYIQHVLRVHVRRVGGAVEQGGLGGGTPPMKRGYGGGSLKLDVKCMFTIEHIL